MSFYSGYSESSSTRGRARPTDRSQRPQPSRMDVDNDSRGSRMSPRRSGPFTRQHDDPYGPHMTGHSHHGYSGHYGHQMVTQEQSFRSAQASTQMVYEVYGNVISILEEFEAREIAGKVSTRNRSLPRSDIYIPDQSHKANQDIERILQTQLLVFQTHLFSACRPEVRNKVVDELKEATKRWIAVRNDKHVKNSKTDEYAAQLYEILLKGKTIHPQVFSQRPDIDERNLQIAAHQYFEGDHRRAQLDLDFARNPSKKASMPPVRWGSSSESGIERIYDQRPDLIQDPTNLR